MQAPLDVGIVGCGFAGCATGLLLARAGHSVTLYERVPEPAAIGAGILLQPTGLAVLGALGVLGPLLERGARVEALHCETAAGRTLFDLHYADLAPGLFGLGMHRGLLFEVLYAEVRASGVTVRCGIDVTRIVSEPGAARIHAADDAPIAEHDLVVVADGARSRLRSRSPALSRARPYAWGALWFVGTDPESRFRGALSQVCEGTQRMLGFLPTGMGPGAGTTPLVSLFWSLPMDSVDAWRRAGLAPWKRELARYAPHAAPLLDQIEDVDQVLTAGYVDGVMRRWHEPRVVYVGDAAHSMSPQLGQGTNLALVDAAVLGACLAEQTDLAAALDDYTRRRRSHVRFYQFASRWLTPLFQSGHTWLGPLRDAVLPLVTRIGPLRSQMLRTLAGIKRGVLRPSLPLAPITTALALPEPASSGARARALEIDGN